MRNIGSYKHLTVPRYWRIVSLLQRLAASYAIPLRALDAAEPPAAPTAKVLDIYRFLDREDQDPRARHAIMKVLRGSGVLVRQRGLPVTYEVRLNRINQAVHDIEAALDVHLLTPEHTPVPMGRRSSRA